MISELAHCSPNGKSNDLGVTWRRADLAELLELELAIRSGGILQIDLLQAVGFGLMCWALIP